MREAAMIMTEPISGKPGNALKRLPENEQADSTPAPVEETELVARARKGDLKAYDQLVQRYQERIYATVYHMTSNHEDANDLAQEAFIKGFQALKSFKGGSSFYTWVYRIAVNKTIGRTARN
jgi:RNA polymerase sigma-70 factor (ECF subfamily)